MPMLPLAAVATVAVTDGFTAASASLAAAALALFLWMIATTITTRSRRRSRLLHRNQRLQYQGGGGDNWRSAPMCRPPDLSSIPDIQDSVLKHSWQCALRRLLNFGEILCSLLLIFAGSNVR